MKAVRVVVSGRVQGVWYRAWTKKRAESLGLDGWVRNLSSGDVEALFAGPDEAVDRMTADCADGPPHARVTAVATFDGEAPEVSGFRVLKSA
jgi:acylphosphatase